MVQNTLDFLMEYGIWGVVIHSFADAVIFPIPVFFLQVSLSMIDPSQALWIATAGYIACLLGTPVGYFLGKGLGHSVLYKILKKEWIDSATVMFQKRGEMAVFIGAFTPIPFKVFTIMSGCLKFPLWKLIGYAAIGRAVKFYLVGFLFYFYGRMAENMVNNASLYVFLIMIPILLIGLWIKKRWNKRRELLALSKQTSDDSSK
ncbi:YqaA family protein [uncultured Brevibacillus sp.]|uniref:YqaA family protein n=1 Tax=uncultured Brevibacillus sp. TaxID=169970 RepID=UPI002599BF6D|nr:VTT domain-containing protein [uncultured Brevibacillus sp.]